MLTGPAAKWLESRREELNHRFGMAKRQHPALTPERALALLERVLPPLADVEGAEPLLDAVYDLVLLHAGRDALASQPGLAVLFNESFPQLRSLLAKRPRLLPASLSNAVENLGARGTVFARAIAAIGAELQEPEVLLDAGAVLAWRLGEARLRESALAVAEKLPAATLLKALWLPQWPAAAAPLALAALQNDAWQAPEARISAATLEALGRSPAEAPSLAKRLREAPVPPLAQWRVVARAGDFTGFGGVFDVPPLVLDGGTRHSLRVRCRDGFFRIEADCFGAVVRPELDEKLAVRAPGGSGAVRRLISRLSASDDAGLAPDGTVSLGGQAARVDALAGASAFAVLENALASTHPDSHRIRILAPWRDPV